MNKVLYLQKLCNKYGDFYITNSFRGEDEELHWFKHRSIIECWESEKGLWFLSKATHRTCLKCEIVLDMDEDISLLRLNRICDSLEKKYNFQYKAYSTGSKGYHIHILVPEMIHETYDKRKKMRLSLIGKTTGWDMDGLKISEKSMIAIENIPHWKTGNIKTLVREYGKSWI